MKKELRPVHDHVSCEVCGRTILKGERTETYLAPGGHRREVCELCFARAEHHGWIRESTATDLPTRAPRAEPRRSLMGRLRGRRPEPAPEAAEAALAEHEAMYGADNGAEAHEPAMPRPRSRPKDPRHVRALPSTAEGKIERALDLFNGSEHRRTSAGLARTLGTPLVAVAPDQEQAAEVTVLVAWELSWYRYRVDLGDESGPVLLQEKGEELHEIEEPLRDWNATMDADGRLVPSQAVPEGGSES